MAYNSRRGEFIDEEIPFDQIKYVLSPDEITKLKAGETIKVDDMSEQARPIIIEGDRMSGKVHYLKDKSGFIIREFDMHGCELSYSIVDPRLPIQRES